MQIGNWVDEGKSKVATIVPLPAGWVKDPEVAHDIANTMQYQGMKAGLARETELLKQHETGLDETHRKFEAINEAFLEHAPYLFEKYVDADGKDWYKSKTPIEINGFVHDHGMSAVDEKGYVQADGRPSKPFYRARVLLSPEGTYLLVSAPRSDYFSDKKLDSYNNPPLNKYNPDELHSALERAKEGLTSAVFTHLDRDYSDPKQRNLPSDFYSYDATTTIIRFDITRSGDRLHLGPKIKEAAMEMEKLAKLEREKVDPDDREIVASIF